MELRKFYMLLLSVLVNVVDCAIDKQPEDVTLVSGSFGSLQCSFTQVESGTWFDSTDSDNQVPLFGGVVGSDNINRGNLAGDGTKYENFDIYSPDGSLTFNLNITNAEFMNDEGTYTCQPQLDPGARATVSIEVPTDRVSISCGSCTGADEPTCDCTCIAQGGYPESLSLQWNISHGNIVSQQPDPPEGPDNNNKYDFSTTASVSISADNALLSCSVQEYVNQAFIETTFSERVLNQRTLSSPECELILTKSPSDDCTVTLECSCQGYPPVNTCTFFTRNGTQDAVIPDNSDLCVINYSVSPGSEVTFLCLGSNGINFTQGLSGEEPSSCPKTPSTESPATTEQGNNGPDGDGGASTAAIVGGVVGGCVVVGGGVIIIILIVKKSGNGEGVNNKAQDFDPPGEAMNNTVTASTFETTNSAPPVYGVVNKSTKKKSDNTDGNGVNSKLQSEPDQVEYAAVNKPKSDPQPAPRSSKPPGNNTEPEKVELQYADIDHSNRGRSNEIRQPADEPTEYATVQSVIV